MARLARTCVLVLVSAAGVVTACGHLPFDELPAGEAGLSLDAGGGADAANPDADGAVDRADGGEPPLEGGSDGDASELDATIGSDGAVADASCALDCGRIYVSFRRGDDQNPGTAEKPLKTIGQATATVTADRRNILVAGGHYLETVKIDRSLTMAGGFFCDENACDWTKAPDPTGNATTIQSTNDFAGSVVVTSEVKNDTILSDLTIVGRDGKLDAVVSPGAVGMALLGGTPTLERLVIQGGNNPKGNGNSELQRSIGLYVVGRAGGAEPARIQSSTIKGGKGDASIGVWLDTLPASVSAAPALVAIEGGSISAQTATASHAVVAKSSSPLSTIEDVTITSSPSTASTTASSWGVVIASGLTLRRNRINTVTLPGGNSYCNSGADSLCGGVRLTDAGTTVIESNLIGGVPAQGSAGVFITAETNAAGKVSINGNVIVARGIGGGPGTISAAIALRIQSSAATNIGLVRNNILEVSADKANDATYGVYEVDAQDAKGHLVALTNNDFWNVEYVYRAWDPTAGAAAITYASFSSVPIPDPSDKDGNIDEDPRLTADGHLEDGSPCIGAGTSKDVTGSDIDDQPRPQGAGYDIGADERP